MTDDAPAAPALTVRLLSLSEINARLGLTVSGALLASLGLHPDEETKTSKRYREMRLPAIVSALITHLQGVK